MNLMNLLKPPASRLPRSPRGGAEIIDLGDPDEVVIPFEYPSQILFRPLVQEGDTVARNQVIGRSELGNYIHASIGGVVSEIRTIWTARGYHVPAAVITRGDVPDMTPDQVLAQCGLNSSSATRLELLKACGAVTPWTTPGRDHRETDTAGYPEIRHVVIKGQNEQPTICNFELLLKERAENIREGLQRLPEIVHQAKLWLTVPQREEKWAREFFGDCVNVVGLREDYKDRIQVMMVSRLTGVPTSVERCFREDGLAVLSVESFLNAMDGLEGKPVVRKTVTLAGGPLTKSVTLRTAVGTSIKALLATQGLNAADFGRVIMGGPMKGTAQYTDETPLSKFQHGVYLLDKRELPSEVNLTCINCGLCSRACPRHLQVHLIGRYVEHDLLADTGQFHPEACLECGLCTFVCPSHRPLVQLVKMANKYGS